MDNGKTKEANIQPEHERREYLVKRGKLNFIKWNEKLQLLIDMQPPSYLAGKDEAKDDDIVSEEDEEQQQQKACCSVDSCNRFIEKIEYDLQRSQLTGSEAETLDNEQKHLTAVTSDGFCKRFRSMAEFELYKKQSLMLHTNDRPVDLGVYPDVFDVSVQTAAQDNEEELELSLPVHHSKRTKQSTQATKSLLLSTKLNAIMKTLGFEIPTAYVATDKHTKKPKQIKIKTRKTTIHKKPNIISKTVTTLL